jgi:predicted acetyltransferase
MKHTGVEDLTLTEASISDGLDILKMLWEIGPGENGFQNNAHDVSERDFPKWLQSRIDMAKGIGLDPKHVPMTTYWLRRIGYPIGISKLRCRLNEALLKRGGHIGFCIRPTERGKGYGNEILRRTVQMADRMGIDRALLTCDLDNSPSWKAIEKCGGKLEKIENGERFYWIDTRLTAPRPE